MEDEGEEMRRSASLVLSNFTYDKNVVEGAAQPQEEQRFGGAKSSPKNRAESIEMGSLGQESPVCIMMRNGSYNVDESVDDSYAKSPSNVAKDTRLVKSNRQNIKITTAMNPMNSIYEED